VIQSTCALVSDRARTAQIALEVDVAPSLPEVRGNAQQISQVLLNLLLNSIQAIGRGGRVTVRAAESGSSRLPAASRALRVTVDDSGPGIAPETLPRLFEPFFTTKAPGEGTGLGLSVSYGILKEHHGAIFAENRAEGGARFEFELPLEASGSESGGTNRPIGARRER
jgi:signal transduction histidine kinase